MNELSPVTRTMVEGFDAVGVVAGSDPRLTGYVVLRRIR